MLDKIDLFIAPKGRHIYRNDKRQNTKLQRSEILWGKRLKV